MAKYIIEMDEHESCYQCFLSYSPDAYFPEYQCYLNPDIDNFDFKNYETEIHKDCPLVKMEE